MASTLPRSMRIPDDVWLPAVKKARADDTSVTAIVIARLLDYVNGETEAAAADPEHHDTDPQR